MNVLKKITNVSPNKKNIDPQDFRVSWIDPKGTELKIPYYLPLEILGCPLCV